MENTVGKMHDVHIQFAGERLCLDFVNTACERRGTKLEFIGNVDDLREWLQSAVVVYGAPLSSSVDDQTSVGDIALKRAIELRLALTELVLSVINKTAAPPAAINALNSVLLQRPTISQLAVFKATIYEISGPELIEDSWLGVIAMDAVQLLCHSDLSLLKQCDCPTCVRVFYDTTKNHKRRWCVQKCGSAPKAASYYRRKVAKTKANML